MIKLAIQSLRLVPPLIAKRTFRNCLWEGPAGCGMVALTFDDGPDPEVTPLVMDALDEIDGTGTFFMLGKNVREHPELARLVGERKQVIGNHSMDHRRMLFMSGKEISREIDESQAAISEAAGIEPAFFRPPYGHFSTAAGREVRRRGLTMALWTALSGDFEESDPEAVYRQVDRFIRPGAIIVFHDTVNGGGATLPDLVRRIGATARDRHLRLGGIDQIAAAWKAENSEP